MTIFHRNDIIIDQIHLSLQYNVLSLIYFRRASAGFRDLYPWTLQWSGWQLSGYFLIVSDFNLDMNYLLELICTFLLTEVISLLYCLVKWSISVCLCFSEPVVWWVCSLQVTGMFSFSSHISRVFMSSHERSWSISSSSARTFQHGLERFVWEVRSHFQSSTHIRVDLFTGHIKNH